MTLDEALTDVRESAAINDWCIVCGDADCGRVATGGCKGRGYSNTEMVSVRSMLETLDFRAALINRVHADNQALKSQIALHNWTHPAEYCEVPDCSHVTVRNCEAAEKVQKFLRKIISGLKERLYKADPNAAKLDWNRLMKALEMPEEYLLLPDVDDEEEVGVAHV